MPKSLLNSEKLLSVLVRQGYLTQDQHSLIIAKKEEQSQILQQQFNEVVTICDNFPQLIDVVVSMQLNNAMDNSLLGEEEIMHAVSCEYDLPFLKLDSLDFDMGVVTGFLPKKFAKQNLVLPFERSGKDGDVIKIAICDPENKAIIHDIEQAHQVKIEPYLTLRDDIYKILTDSYDFSSSIARAEDRFELDLSDDEFVDLGNLEQFVRISTTEPTATDRHIKSAVNRLFTYAFEQRASDIHIEPKRNQCVVRFRIDGVLYNIFSLPITVHDAIIARIKYLARLDIAEKRRAQDGRIKVGVGKKIETELRVSTISVSFGEKMVLRVLDPKNLFRDFASLGFSQRDQKKYNEFCATPHGLVLITGPTGSGKTTTLYSTLKEISSPEKNIITIEDPVEMICEEFNQIAVQPQIDITFANAMPNILRQDPDIIMLGEIRDKETAAYAVQAAMTGHLVLSTLHTNDALSAIVRLSDLGLKKFLISSSLLGVVAQRLVRKNCSYCQESFVIEKNKLKDMGLPVDGNSEIKLIRGRGCSKCRETGYIGRVVVLELVTITKKLQDMISHGSSLNELQQLAIKQGMTTLKEDAWNKVKAGITTYEEVVKVL